MNTSAKVAKYRLNTCLEKDRIQSAVFKDREMSNRSTGPDGFQRGVILDSPRSPSNIARTATFDRAMTLSAVFACHKILAETVASLPIEMFVFDKNRNRTPVFDHELIKLLRNKPNDHQTNIEFKETLMLNLINGNAYVRKYYWHKQLIQLEVINNGVVFPKLNDKGKVEYHVSYFNNKKEILTTNEIWHIKLFGNGLVGMSPLAYGARTIGIGLATDDKVGKIMENGAKQHGYLSTDPKVRLKQEQRDGLRKEFQDMIYGDEFFLPVLEGGLTFNKMSLTPEDIELLENRRFTVEEICRFYGVPSVLVNDTNGSTTWGSGITELVDAFYRFGLRHFFERIEESIRLNLIDRVDWDKYEFEFKIKDLLRASIKDRVDINSKRINSAQSTINEIRREEGDPSIENGDQMLVAANLVPLDRLIQTPQGNINETQ